jgi:hypothetical protein
MVLVAGGSKAAILVENGRFDMCKASLTHAKSQPNM